MSPERERERKRAWKLAHPEKVRAGTRAYSERNRQRLKAKSRARYLAKKEHCLAVAAAWKVANKDKVRAAARARYALKRESILAQQKAWRKSKPEIHAEHEGRRRARIRGTVVGDVDYAKILRESDGRCGICRKPLDLFGIHFDHVIPLSNGGTHTADNIQPTHARCNLEKGARVAA